MTSLHNSLCIRSVNGPFEKIEKFLFLCNTPNALRSMKSHQGIRVRESSLGNELKKGRNTGVVYPCFQFPCHASHCLLKSQSISIQSKIWQSKPSLALFHSRVVRRHSLTIGIHQVITYIFASFYSFLPHFKALKKGEKRNYMLKSKKQDFDHLLACQNMQ